MAHQFYLFGCGIIGLISWILFNLISMQSLAKKANAHFNWIAVLKDDFLKILSNILSIIALLACWKGISNLVHFLQEPDVDKAFFILWGGFGGEILNRAMAGYRSKVLKIIDEKTNLADSNCDTADSLPQVFEGPGAIPPGGGPKPPTKPEE